MRILITGSTGLIGGAALRHLRDAGHDVRALVRTDRDAGTLAALGFDVAVGTLADPASLVRAAEGCEAVVHAAGIASPEASKNALGWTHVAGTENLTRAAQKAGVKRFVHVSCADASLTGEPRQGWHEDRPLLIPLVDAHARTKRESEEVVLGLGSVRFEPVIVRPARVWGPGDRVWLPELCREALRGGITCVGRGLSFMATTYVGNLAHGIERALVTTDARGLVYHVLDRELTIQRPFFDRLSLAVGLPPARKGGSMRVERAKAWFRARAGKEGLTRAEVFRRGIPSSFDGRAAKEELGYEPPFSQEEGMLALEAWAREVGGPQGIIARARPIPGDAEVEAQMARSAG